MQSFTLDINKQVIRHTKPYTVKIIFLILSLFIFVGLQSQNLPVVKYTSLSQKDISDCYFEKPQTWFREIQYVGRIKDTINIIQEQSSRNFKTIIPKDNYWKLYSSNCENCISIQIDTSQLVSMKSLAWRKRKVITKYYPSYPVFIKNKTDSLIKIGFGSNVNILAEALDTDNLWKPIEGYFHFDCGTGLESIHLMSEEVACILFPKYSGSFNTKIRLRLNDNISEAFNGTINPSQFINRINN